MADLTHIDDDGNAFMVDVSEKEITTRQATAQGLIKMSQEAFDAVTNKQIAKGDVLTVAQTAGIMGVKRTADLIPMCHAIRMNGVKVTFTLLPELPAIQAVCSVKCDEKTGAEMEALTGVMTTLLTIYDMCKALDKRMVIENVHLVQKSGGKSGDFSF